ncbi:MAG: patatin-like phospholipase family protein [Saprospiraceae bacterium]
MKKYALVLSGGGFNGAFQFGALEFLKENWNLINQDSPQMKFDIVAGVSAGSLNGYMIASDQFEKLNELWGQIGLNGEKEIYTSDFLVKDTQTKEVKLKLNLKKLGGRLIPNVISNFSVWKSLGQLLFNRKKFVDQLLEKVEQEALSNMKGFKSVADNAPLKQKLETLVRRDAIKNKIYRCGFVSLDDGEYHTFRHDQFSSDAEFLHAIIASTSMPIAWEPVPSVKVGNTEYKNCVDGAIRENSPLSEVIDEINLDPSNDEYTIIIINCHTGKVNSKPFADANIGQIALRSLYDITLSEIFNTDLKEFIRINDLVEQAGSHRSGLKLLNYDFKNRKRTNKALKDFKAILIEPDANELGDPLAADEDLITHRIAHGRLKAEKSLLGDSPLGGNGQNPNQNGPSSGPPQPGTP